MRQQARAGYRERSGSSEKYAMRFVVREEAECGGGSGGAYYDHLPLDKAALEKWWSDTKTAVPLFRLYAVFLATKLDADVVSFVQSSRPELAELSGKSYFRESSRAEKLSPWDYSEHEKMVHPVARLIGIEPIQLPCVVFFERITSGKYARVPLRDVSRSDMPYVMRDVFMRIGRDDQNPFRQVCSYNRAVFWRTASKALKRNLYEIAKEVGTEFLKTMVAVK
jgi:hypothetical protein